MKIIIKDLEPDDWILGVRAARSLLARPEVRDMVISYVGASDKRLYAKRNKASITVRPTS